jgi:hypothetical protein
MRLPFTKSKVAPSAQNSDVANPPPSDAEQVRAKLANVETSIAAAEAELRQASLAAALSDDADAGYDAVARLHGLRGRKAILEAALAEALRIETDAQAALRHREWVARKRSLAQKAGQLDRDAADVAKATKALHEARSRMSDTASGIAALLPRQLRTPAKPWHELMGPMLMRQLGLLAMWSLDQTGPRPDRIANYLGGNFQNARTGQVRAISEIVGELTHNLKAEFDRTGPVALAPEPSGPFAAKLQPQPPLPASGSMPVLSAPASVSSPPASQAGSAPTSEPASARNEDPATDTAPSEKAASAASAEAALLFFTTTRPEEDVTPDA